MPVRHDGLLVTPELGKINQRTPETSYLARLTRSLSSGFSKIEPYSRQFSVTSEPNHNLWALKASAHAHESTHMHTHIYSCKNSHRHV